MRTYRLEGTGLRERAGNRRGIRNECNYRGADLLGRSIGFLRNVGFEREGNHRGCNFKGSKYRGEGRLTNGIRI